MKETLTDISPGNPATREGTAISIGFDKASRLESVFGHYLEFLNRQPLDPPPPLRETLGATATSLQSPRSSSFTPTFCAPPIRPRRHP